MRRSRYQLQVSPSPPKACRSSGPLDLHHICTTNGIHSVSLGALMSRLEERVEARLNAREEVANHVEGPARDGLLDGPVEHWHGDTPTNFMTHLALTRGAC